MEPRSQRKIELTWGCSSCQHVNRGRLVSCERCGNPKDASERYEMPSSTTSAPTVTDPALLGLASAGPNWQCGYCGSHQRALDGSCAECGAVRKEPRPVALGADALVSSGDDPGRTEASARRRRLLLAAVVAVGVASLIVLVGWALTPRETDLEVVAVRWEHRVHVDRWQIWAREGFAESVPATAFEQRALGERHHHDEQVLDRYETETYTEQVACGQDCVDEPEHCEESCTDDGNGFATCTTSCSGGGQSCSTRYCPETRTREVPVYRTVPVSATWYAYRVWDWGEVRVLRASGTSLETRWPAEEEVRLGQGLGEGERERVRQEHAYEVSLREAGEEELRTYVPETLPELRRFAPGSVHHARIHLGGRLEWAAP